MCKGFQPDISIAVTPKAGSSADDKVIKVIKIEKKANKSAIFPKLGERRLHPKLAPGQNSKHSLLYTPGPEAYKNNHPEEISSKQKRANLNLSPGFQPETSKKKDKLTSKR